MFNPLVDKLSQLTDAEIENKITEISRKYFMTRNAQLQTQMSVVLNMYKEELQYRRAISAQKLKEQDGDSDLDNLINVS